MAIAGIICEYNPFHLGHRKQFAMVREALGGDTAIVCLMSGNYVQRGAPAVFDKTLRAEAALRCGADLVLELPVPVSLSSAEGFAAGGVGILSELCTHLAFGCETADSRSLEQTVQGLLDPGFSSRLRQALESGISFPAAREQALSAMGISPALLRSPNDTLAVEYCKAIAVQGSALAPLPLRREGMYHAQYPDPENPSAASLRLSLAAGEDWLRFVPSEAAPIFQDAPLHTLDAGERAVLYRLRTMTEAEFEALPYGSEGLWRRFLRECRRGSTLEEILSAVKTKRYTRTRLDRMVLCAFLGLTKEALSEPAPYVRILGFTDRGREILRGSQGSIPLRNAGAPGDGEYWEAEKRWGDLYGLFRTGQPDPPGQEQNRRIIYCSHNPSYSKAVLPHRPVFVKQASIRTEHEASPVRQTVQE